MAAPRYDDYYTSTMVRPRRSTQGHSSSQSHSSFSSLQDPNGIHYSQPRSSPDRSTYDAMYYNQWNTGALAAPNTHSNYGLYEQERRHSNQVHLSSSSHNRWDSHASSHSSNPYPAPVSGHISAPVASYPTASYISPDPYPLNSEPHAYSTYESHHRSNSPTSHAYPSSHSSVYSSAPTRDQSGSSHSHPRSSHSHSSASPTSGVPVTPPSSHYPPQYSESPPDESMNVKKKRRKADAAQLKVLNEVWERTAFPSTEERAELAKKLDMSPRSVQIWFQNKRQNMRQSMRQSTVTSGSHQPFAIPDDSPVDEMQPTVFNGYSSDSAPRALPPSSGTMYTLAPARSSGSATVSRRRSSRRA